jgi:hypothetical protein
LGKTQEIIPPRHEQNSALSRRVSGANAAPFLPKRDSAANYQSNIAAHAHFTGKVLNAQSLLELNNAVGGDTIECKMRTTMSSARIAAWAAIFTLLPAGYTMAKPITLAGDTNLRSSPGTNSTVMTLISKGTSVEVGKCSNGWCQTSYNGQDGYTFARNLGMAPRPAPRGPLYGEEEVVDEGPVVYGPPVYYGYGYRPFFGFYGGWGWGRYW